MGTRKNEIRNQQIRFQYAGVFDGFYLSSLTPTPNPKHLLQVWNRLGAKRLFFFFVTNCLLCLLLLLGSHECWQYHQFKASVGLWLRHNPWTHDAWFPASALPLTDVDNSLSLHARPVPPSMRWGDNEKHL